MRHGHIETRDDQGKIVVLNESSPLGSGPRISWSSRAPARPGRSQRV